MMNYSRVCSMMIGFCGIASGMQHSSRLDEILASLMQYDALQLLCVSDQNVHLWEECYQLMHQEYDQSDTTCDIDALRAILMSARHAALTVVDLSTPSCEHTRALQRTWEDYEATLQILYNMLLKKIRDARAFNDRLYNEKYSSASTMHNTRRLLQLSQVTLRAAVTALEIVKRAQVAVY